MDVLGNLQVTVSSEGDPPRLIAVFQAVRDEEPIGEPSDQIYLAPGQILTYGPIGLSVSINSQVTVAEGQEPKQPEQPKEEAPQRQPQPQRQHVKPGQAQLNKIR